MKHGLFILIMIIILINNAYGINPSVCLPILAESMEDGSAVSIGYVGNNIVYLGLSLNYIKSSNVIQNGNRRSIFPVYFILGLKAHWKVSPYFEAGGDVVDAIIDDSFNNNKDAVNEIDYYYSGGLVFSASDKLSFSLYAKKYNFIYRDFLITSKFRPDGFGVGVILKY